MYIRFIHTVKISICNFSFMLSCAVFEYCILLLKLAGDTFYINEYGDVRPLISVYFSNPPFYDKVCFPASYNMNSPSFHFFN